MRDSLRLGRVAGIPIGVNWSVVIVAVAVVALLTARILPSVYSDIPLAERLGSAVVGALLFFISILGHEMGHALVARRHQVGVAGITLWLLGGVAKLTRQAPTPRAEFQIAIAGPIASLVFGGAFIASAVGFDRWTAYVLPPVVLTWLGAVNVLLAVSNLLPGAPLDGGRVLTAAIWKRIGNAEHARLLSARCGMILGSLITFAGLLQAVWFDQASGWWTAAVGGFVIMAARGEIQGAAIRSRLADVTAAQLMAQYPTPVADSLTIDQAFGPSEETGADSPLARPVVKWEHEPVGYVTATMAEGLDITERSWTRVGAVMSPASSVARAWAGESIQTILDRADGSVDHVTVIHDPGRGMPVGTLSRRQIEGLFVPPDFWGRTQPPI